MITTGWDNLGKFVLRVGVAALLLLHGINKIQHGTSFIEGLLDKNGLPTFMAYGAYVGEVLAPALVIVGFQTRLSALVMAGTMGMAIFLAHASDLGRLTAHGGWSIELPALFLIGSLAIACLGPGRFSIEGRRRV